MKIRVKFKTPIQGFWNGTKSGGEFEVEPGQRAGGKYLRWGCYSLNHWIECKAGSNDIESAKIARRALKRSLGNRARVSIVKEG